MENYFVFASLSLLIFLIFFHCLMVFLKKAPRFWIIIDYVWILIGSSALYTATFHSQQIMNSKIVSDSKISLPIDYSYSQMLVISAKQHYRFVLIDSMNIFSKEKEIRYRKAFEFYDSTLQILWNFPNSQTLDSIMIAARKLTREDIDEDIPLFSLNELSKSFELIKTRLNDIEEYSKPYKETETETILKIISPILLAIAISLRLTKVTATLMGYTKL